MIRFFAFGDLVQRDWGRKKLGAMAEVDADGLGEIGAFLGDAVRVVPTAGAVADVLAEREKQRAKWGDAHDDEHASGELGAVAAVLLHPEAPPVPCGCREAMCQHVGFFDPPAAIPAPGWALPLRRKAVTRRRQLVIGAALALAEIERMDRAEARRKAGDPEQKWNDAMSEIERIDAADFAAAKAGR